MDEEIKSLSIEEAYHNLTKKVKDAYPIGPERDSMLQKIDEWHKKPFNSFKSIPTIEEIEKFKIQETVLKNSYTNPKSNQGASIGIATPKRARVYPKEFAELGDEIKKEVIKIIDIVSDELSKDSKRRLRNWGLSFLLLTLLSSTAIIYFAKNYVNRYSQQYISQGKQFSAVQKRIEKNQEGLEKNHSGLANNQASLDKRVLDQANKLYLIEKDILNIDESRKKQFSSLETNLNEQKISFDQFKNNIEETMKSDYKEFLDLNNSTSKEIMDLSAKLIALEKELPKSSAYDKKLNDLVSDVNNLNTKIGELNRNIEKIDRESISKEDFNKLKNELEVIKKDYKPLKEKIESITKQE